MYELYFFWNFFGFISVVPFGMKISLRMCMLKVYDLCNSFVCWLVGPL
jgi:hypothetical protein